MSEQPLAKKEEEKKKGAAPIPGGGGAGGSFSLEQLESLQLTLHQAAAESAVIATGAGGAAAAIGSKVAMIVLVAMLGAGAMNMSRLNARNKPVISPPRKPAEKIKYEGDLSKVPSKPDDQPAIQGVVIGNMDGKTDEQRAAEAAAADAAAKADAERQAKDDAAAKAAAAAPAPVAASATPAMKAGDLTSKAAKIAKANTFDKKFGQLSSSLGSGNSGLAGGIGGSFGRSISAPSLGKSGGMQGNAAAKGGAATKALGMGRGGRAFRQLVNANQQSRSAARSTGEGAAQGASGAFDNNRGGGTAITGGGAGITGQGVHMGDSDSKPNQGGPIGQGPQGDGTQAAPTAGHKNATPWQTAVDVAMYCGLAAGLLLGVAKLLMKSAKSTIPIGAGLFLAAQICAGLAAACAAVVMVCGGIVMGHGQTMQGGIMMAIGGVIGYLAIDTLTTDKEPDATAKIETTGTQMMAGSPMDTQLEAPVVPQGLEGLPTGLPAGPPPTMYA